jgi:DNA adenine methylase
MEQLKKQTYKSPLRYPGGKTRAIKYIYPYIPANVTELCSPFLGGASFELFLSSKGIKIYGYDLFEPLTNFWNVLLNNSFQLYEAVKKMHPISKEYFYKLRNEYDKYNNINKAAIFYVLNRSSFSGATFSGGMSKGHPRFTESSINKLYNFKNNLISVENADFEIAINNHPTSFLYLDPPYLINDNLYGDKGNMHKYFDHKRLYNILSKRDDWILSYNDCKFIRELYSDYNIVDLDWKYGMSKNKKSSEILIINKE